MEQPVKGWLHKTRKGMMMKAAQRHRRWFVLEGTTLSWYVDESETADAKRPGAGKLFVFGSTRVPGNDQSSCSNEKGSTH